MQKHALEMKKNIRPISPPMKGWAESCWWVRAASKASTSLSVGEHFSPLLHSLYYKAHWELKAAFLKELLCNCDIWGFQSLPFLNWLWNTLNPEGSTSAVYKSSPLYSSILALSTGVSSAWSSRLKPVFLRYELPWTAVGRNPCLKCSIL